MKPLKSREITGTWATLLLPINEDESIDFSRLADEIDCLLATGVDGIYTNGTAGEFFAQSEDEFDRIHALLAEKCESAGRPFQIGASHMSAQISLSRVRRAAALKPSAIQIILPDWVPVSLEEAIAFLQRVAAAAGSVGLVLYNPPHAKRVLQPADYTRLAAAVPALVGLKVGGEKEWYADIRRRAPQVSMFVPGHQLATGYTVGAAGSYSNVACLQPAAAKRWNELMKVSIQAALALEAKIQRFMNDHILSFREQRGYSNAALDKLLAAIGAWSNVGTRLRWPYRWIEGSEAKRLRPIARHLVPELFEN